MRYNLCLSVEKVTDCNIGGKLELQKYLSVGGMYNSFLMMSLKFSVARTAPWRLETIIAAAALVATESSHLSVRSVVFRVCSFGRCEIKAHQLHKKCLFPSQIHLHHYSQCYEAITPYFEPISSICGHNGLVHSFNNSLLP